MTSRLKAATATHSTRGVACIQHRCADKRQAESRGHRWCFVTEPFSILSFVSWSSLFSSTVRGEAASLTREQSACSSNLSSFHSPLSRLVRIHGTRVLGADARSAARGHLVVVDAVLPPLRRSPAHSRSGGECARCGLLGGVRGEAHGFEGLLVVLAGGQVAGLEEADLQSSTLARAHSPSCTMSLLRPLSPPSFHHGILTILKSLHTVSLGCAPTPNQYFARATSTLISLTLRWPSSAPMGVLGIGS